MYKQNHHFFPATLIVCLVCVAYIGGLSGPFFYDDYGNLEFLGKVNDLSSFWGFITAGAAGPLGRPVSLASFALQAGSWPSDSGAFLKVNLFIHLVNSVLLFYIFRFVLRRCSIQRVRENSVIASFIATLLWSLMPINISTTLIVIQRMTGLSSMFGLIGILCYLNLYSLYKSVRFKSFAPLVQIGTLAFFSVLAVYSKESGLLFPIFMLVLEVSLLHEYSKSVPFRTLRIAALSIPLIVVIYYLSPLNIEWFTVSEKRGFSAWERVTTEWVILWSYIKSALLPLPTQFSPFYDDVVIIKSSRIIISGLCWLLVVVLSIVSIPKTRLPIFIVLWFLAGHLLESTSVLLELVFEHRNYIASYGLCLGLVAALFSVPEQYFRISIGVLISYTVMIFIICISVTSLWGRPMNAAEVWSASKLKSSRAALHLATLDIEAMGGSSVDASLSIVQKAKRDRALLRLDRTIVNCAECLDVKLQALLLACDYEERDVVASRYMDIMKHIAISKITRPAIDALFPLSEMVGENLCNGVGMADLSALVEKLRVGQKVNEANYQSKLDYIAAEIAYMENDIPKAEEMLRLAEGIDPVAIPVLKMQVHLAVEKRNYADALNAVLRRKKVLSNNTGEEYEILQKMELEIHKLIKVEQH